VASRLQGSPEVSPYLKTNKKGTLLKIIKINLRVLNQEKKIRL